MFFLIAKEGQAVGAVKLTGVSTRFRISLSSSFSLLEVDKERYEEKNKVFRNSSSWRRIAIYRESEEEIIGSLVSPHKLTVSVGDGLRIELKYFREEIHGLCDEIENNGGLKYTLSMRGSGLFVTRSDLCPPETE